MLDFEPAGVASRVMARLIDVASQIAVLSLLANFLVVLAAGGDTALIVGLLITGFLTIFGYPAVLEAVNGGRTLGKMAIGLRVVTVEGGPVRLRHTSVRSMMQVIDIIVTLGGAAVATAVLSPRGQRLGDVLAGTLVIRERKVSSVLAERAVLIPNPAGLDGLVGSIDPSPLGAEQAALLRGFLLRVTELDLSARVSIAERLSQRVSERLGQPRPADVHPETWLACVAAALQRRSEHAAGTIGPDRLDPVRPSSLRAPPPRTSSLRAPPPPPPTAVTGSVAGRGWEPPS